MKTKKVILFIVFVAIMLILNSTSVLAFRAPIATEIYNRTSLIISIIMKLIIFIVFISYVVFFIISMIKSKKDKNEKIKKLIKWLIIAVIIILILWFSSETVKKIGMTIKYY